MLLPEALFRAQNAQKSMSAGASPHAHPTVGAYSAPGGRFVAGGEWSLGEGREGLREGEEEKGRKGGMEGMGKWGSWGE